MPSPIQTERLNLRPLRTDDFAFVRGLHLNQEILRNSGSAQRTQAQSQRGFDRCLEIASEDARLGSWIVELRAGPAPIGNLILRHPATAERIEGLELGYSLLPEFWGLGYAQEATRAMIRYAYREFGAVRLVALIAPENSRSRNVLTKTGFTSIGVTEYVDPSTGEVKVSELLERLR